MKQLNQQLIDKNKHLEDRVSELCETNVHLEHSNKNLIGVFSSMVDGLIFINAKGLINELNATAEDIFGYSQKEIIGKKISVLMPKPFENKYDTYMNHHRETAESKIIGVRRELIGKRKNGSEFPMELAISESINDGEETRYTGIVRDISERKKVEKALKRQHIQLETIQRAQAEFISGAEPVILFERLLPDFLTLSNSEFGFISKFMLDENGEQYLKAYALSNISWDDVRRIFFNKNTSEELVFLEPDCLLGKALLDGKPFINNNYINEQAAKCRSEGHSPLKAFLSLPVYFGKQLMGIISVANSPDGYDKNTIHRLQPLLSACGHLFAAMDKERDRTEAMEKLEEEVRARKNTQAELRATNENLEVSVSERADDLQLLYLVSSILINVEHPLEEIFNTIVSAIAHYLPNHNEMCVRIIFDDMCCQNKDSSTGKVNISRAININGIKRGAIEIISIPDIGESDTDLFENDKESLIEAICYDINSTIERRLSLEEHQSMEVKLRQAQKLESVGQLAAGIAHEINTPAQFVNDNANFLKDAFTDYSQLLEIYERISIAADGKISVTLLDELKSQLVKLEIDYLKEEIPQAIKQSLDGLQRITKIVQAMKEFSHPGSDEKTLSDLNRAIKTTIDVSCNEWKYAAELITELEPTLPQVPVLLGELNQVILNLIVNAAQAIVDFSTEKSFKGEIRIVTCYEDDWAIIKISDNGGGMTDEVKGRIFDPFFTTKEVGKGSGQGLAIAWSVIVDKHEGFLEIESEKGKGSTFTIRLPTNITAVSSQV